MNTFFPKNAFHFLYNRVPLENKRKSIHIKHKGSALPEEIIFMRIVAKARDLYRRNSF